VESENSDKELATLYFFFSVEHFFFRSPQWVANCLFFDWRQCYRSCSANWVIEMSFSQFTGEGSSTKNWKLIFQPIVFEELLSSSSFSLEEETREK
jgi:hypothetical protein